MRWKLANGGVVGTTKQPLQNKDFDRLIIESDDINNLTNQRWFDCVLINPSTHTIRKSYNGRGIPFRVGPKVIGQTGGSWTHQDFAGSNIQYLSNLQTGANYFSALFGNTSKHYSGTRDDDEKYFQYIKDTYLTEYGQWFETYRITLTRNNGGHYNSKVKYLVSNEYEVYYDR